MKTVLWRKKAWRKVGWPVKHPPGWKSEDFKARVITYENRATWLYPGYVPDTRKWREQKVRWIPTGQANQYSWYFVDETHFPLIFLWSNSHLKKQGHLSALIRQTSSTAATVFKMEGRFLAPFTQDARRDAQRNASKWDLLSPMGVFTLHASNTKGFALEFAWCCCVRVLCEWGLWEHGLKFNLYSFPATSSCSFSTLDYCDIEQCGFLSLPNFSGIFDIFFPGGNLRWAEEDMEVGKDCKDQRT